MSEASGRLSCCVSLHTVLYLSVTMMSKCSAVSVPGKAKKERKTLTIAEKVEVIRRMESGERRSDVCKALSLAPSTVSTIMNNVDKIKRTHTGMSSASSSRTIYSRSETMGKMEKLLVLWVDDMNQNNVPVTQAVILDKAKSLFDEICKESGSTETFTASRGWFHRFKNRSKIHNVKLSGEAASADIAVAEQYPSEFKRLIDEGNYHPDLVFNVDETGLYWKKLPSRTYIACEERSAPGFKVAKDRLTLLLGGNASGTFKLKPMLVYHSETPRVMKGIVKTRLPVFWRSNKKAWVTQTIFSEWYTTYFCPGVAQFCAANGFPPKVMLVLDNAPGHPANLQEINNDDLEVEVVYLPPNTTSLLQPMDQGVIATFKAYYLRTTFKGIVEAVQSDITVRDYWKSYNILKAITNIDSAWDEVSLSCMNGVWRKLWPEAVTDFVGIEPVSDVAEDVSRMAKDVGIDNVDPDDVEQLLESHGEPLSREELEELAVQLQQHEADTPDEGEELEPIRTLKTTNIKSALAQISSAFDELCDNDPDWERSHGIQRSVNLMLKPYYNILEERSRKSRQQSMLQFLTKKRKEPPESDDPQPGTSQ